MGGLVSPDRPPVGHSGLFSGHILSRRHGEEPWWTRTPTGRTRPASSRHRSGTSNPCGRRPRPNHCPGRPRRDRMTRFSRLRPPTGHRSPPGGRAPLPTRHAPGRRARTAIRAAGWLTLPRRPTPPTWHRRPASISTNRSASTRPIRHPRCRPEVGRSPGHRRRAGPPATELAGMAAAAPRPSRRGWRHHNAQHRRTPSAVPTLPATTQAGRAGNAPARSLVRRPPHRPRAGQPSRRPTQPPAHHRQDHPPQKCRRRDRLRVPTRHQRTAAPYRRRPDGRQPGRRHQLPRTSLGVDSYARRIRWPPWAFGRWPTEWGSASRPVARSRRCAATWRWSDATLAGCDR